jgi:lipopolysaccharide/colanic/teichoic acid biosynthesis glycosyltransferase
VRRAVDLLVAVPILVLLSPLLLALVVAIRRESPGPGFFRQVRIGRDGEPFRIVKLRTMRTDSGDPSRMASRQDPRVTPLGERLRKSHLDELPQLINVVRGEMTLIGPRPEIPEFVALYSPEQRVVLGVPPGITGPGQIEYATRFQPLLDGAEDPNRVYIEQVLGPKLDLDLDYLRRRSLAADLGVIRDTIRAILRPRPTAEPTAAASPDASPAGDGSDVSPETEPPAA